MTESRDSLRPRHEGVGLVLQDLACVSGTLSEIATQWRRARPKWPELPLDLPIRLQESARQLAAAIKAGAGAVPVRSASPAPSLPEQLAALRERVAAARAMSCGRGIGDTELWQSVYAALLRAAGRACVTGTEMTDMLASA